MGMNRMNDTVYAFWVRYGFSETDAQALKGEFQSSTVEQMLAMSQDEQKKKIDKLPWTNLRRMHAAQTLIREKKRLSDRTPLKTLIYGRDAFYKNHKLYAAVGLYKDSTKAQIDHAVHNILQAHSEMISRHRMEINQYKEEYANTNRQVHLAMLQRHQMEITQLYKNYEEAKLFLDPAQKLRYDNKGDKYGDEPVHRHQREDYPVIRPPPQPGSPMTPVQRYRPPSNSPPPRTPAGSYPVYAPPPDPPPAHLVPASGPPPEYFVAKDAREREIRHNKRREERRLRDIHRAMEDGY